jgi:hypothetical protein
MALVSALLVMMLMSALLVGFFAVISADQRSSGVNRDQTQAYAAAHAGLEKLTADLGAVFTGGNYSPSAAQLDALTAAPPVLPNFQFVAPDGGSGYTITPQPVITADVQNGPFQGLRGLITPYTITVTARASAVAGGGAETRMRREVQTVAVPVFQFGIFSENDLSFFAGPNFDFGGRVHSNQNIYLAQDGAATLRLREVVSAVGEVVRTHLSNGLPISTSGHRGYVELATTGGSSPTFRRLSCGSQGGNCGGSVQEGSVNVSSVPPSTQQVVDGQPTMVLVAGNTANDPTWFNVTTGTAPTGYEKRLKNGRTGARRLDLPIVSNGAAPIDLIRRPSAANPDNSQVLAQRYFSMGSLRILLSDRAADITGLQTVTAGIPPVDLARLATDAAYRANPQGTGVGVNWVNGVPLAQAAAYAASGGSGYRINSGSAVIRGFLKIERQDRNGTWSDVTVELLNLGFTARNIADAGAWNVPGTTCAASAADDPSPDAVIRLQRVRDNPSNQSAGWRCGRSSAAGNPWSSTPSDYIPLVLYDAREGTRRDDERTAAPGIGYAAPFLGGVMHYVELDVNNLRRWLAGAIGTTGASNTMDVTGYVVYFSDRRGNKNLGADGLPGATAGADGLLGTADDFGDDLETGEFGFEDFVNPALETSIGAAANLSGNGVLDVGEDMNGNGVLDTYGGVPRPQPDIAQTNYPWNGFASAGVVATVMTQAGPNEVRVNPPLFFRRALKVVNGRRNQLPANGRQGLTLAAENPVYLQGNFNACLTTDAANTCTGGFGTTDDGHVSAAIVADALTMLSNEFNDIRTFGYTTGGGTTYYAHLVGGRPAPNDAWYRLGVIAGKGISFAKPTSNAQDHTDFGTDGGAHNFLRYIERWDGALNYRGSIVSFFTSRQAIGAYKCCNVVYDPPARGYRFDDDFLTPELLPPRTPMFRDVNTLTFRQLLRPTQ